MGSLHAAGGPLHNKGAADGARSAGAKVLKKHKIEKLKSASASFLSLYSSYIIFSPFEVLKTGSS